MSYTHLPCIPSGRLNPSFGQWRFCLLGALAGIWECWPLDFNSSHPILAKRAVVRALMDRAENVCSDPGILAKEMEYLNRVLCYNNYPQWIINKQGKSDKQDPIIHPKTGFEIKKCFYILVPYFLGLSESYKKIFKYTPIQVCFKGVNCNFTSCKLLIYCKMPLYKL